EIAKFHTFLRGAPRVGDAALLSRASLCTRGGPRCRCACRTLVGGVVAPQYCVRDQGRALIERSTFDGGPAPAAYTRLAPMRVNDPRGFDFGLGETADMLRDSVRGFAAERISPRADEIDRSNTFPRDLWPELGKLGVHGITVEEEWGG